MNRSSAPSQVDHVGTFRRACLIVLMVLLVVLDVFTIVQGIVLGEGTFIALGLGVLFTFFPLVAWLALRGRVLLGAHLMLGVLFLVILKETWQGNGLFSEGPIYTFFLIVLGGLLTTPRGLVFWTGMSLGGIGLLAYGHGADHIFTTPEDARKLWSFTVEMMVIHVIGGLSMLSVQWLQRRTLHDLENEVAIRKDAEARALEAVCAKERFLATMSHELRTPLNGILGAAALLPSAERNEQAELTGMITASADLLLALVNDVLDFSRMGAEAMELEALPVHLEALLTEVTAPLSLLAQQKGVRLSVDVDPALPPWCTGDPTRLRQIVLNLTSNAIKFTEHGEVAVSVGREGERWRLTVRDTGIGIPQDAHARLFAPFAQADASTTRCYGGTGLGLAIVRRIVDRMGGTIALESAVGVGSTFTVCLPLLPATAPQAEPEKTRDADLGEPRALRILVVDDHPINRIVAVRNLVLAGHDCEEAGDGIAACERAGEGGWDLILMDCLMPRRDGYEATRLIRQLSAPACAVPIIGLSANATVEDRRRALAAGMDDYLTKPIQPAALIEAIARLGQRAA